MINNNRPRRTFFTQEKKQCWERAEIIPGRDPARWRFDAAGNPVLNILRGCLGQFCHEYDHILPFSKGGETSVENCQILQTHLNRYKSNRNLSLEELKKESIKQYFSDREMDLIEIAAYGSVKKPTEENQNEN
ncbi:hypothetical protein SteCoe_7566 [Stentor coeruleus]|uniref:HNH nuclease domain-containing protein n=1 Tax=Stentor coeruleus TaxID=5963 RepID=A0A1R2CMK0_9CILI|nr:hypothetical protein SteCoe_7566 [Stentor coeruleus]